jgi:hypothetical protein
LIGGAAVVVAGVIDRVVVLDESVVLDAEDEGACDCDCDCDCDCVVELVLKVEGWDVDSVDDGDEGDEVDEGDTEETVGDEVDVMVVSVVSVPKAEDAAVDAEDAAEDDAEDAAEDIAEDIAEELPATTADEDAVVEEAEGDTETKLPPLLNNVTVAGCPLITTVDAVTVVPGPALAALLPTELPLLTTLVCVVPIVNENEYVVLGLKDSGIVANADESTESAFVVSGVASGVVDREVMVVYCVDPVVWIGMITATVKDGGIDTVAIVKSVDGL